jgi:NAD(P)-dependent dehydrogenase (short-subunit alcohol dehydrogenase family)
MSRFDGRVVVITGAAGGVGSVLTRAWLAEGATVIAVDRSEQTLSRLEPHQNLRPLPADLGSPEGASAMAGACDGADTIIHLVGGFDMGPFDQISHEGWMRMFDMNVHTTFHTFQAMLPVLRKHPESWMLAMGSAAVETTPAQMSAYVASKSAVVALAKCLAAEVRHQGVHVNALMPATIDTPANRAEMGDAAAKNWVRAEDIASASMFLCSPQAQSVHGAVLRMAALS